MTSNTSQSGQRPGTLRLFDMILFSVCAMLLLSQVTLTAQVGPSAVVWTVIIIALFFIPYGLITAELGSTYPDAGGIYSWVLRAFGNSWGTRTAWWYWVNVALWVPSVYLMFSAVLSAMFFPNLGFWPQVGIAVALIVANWVVNVLTLDVGKWVSNLGAVITVTVMGVIGVAGIYSVASNGSSATEFAWSTDSMIPTAATMAIALPIIIYNFLGFELMSSASNEMRNPRRDVPRTIIIAGLLIGTFYLVATVGMQMVLPPEEISTSGLMDVLHLALGTTGFASVVVNMLGVGILYAFFAALIPWTIGANRAAAEAAMEGNLPAVFNRTHNRRGTPTGAATLTALVSLTITLVYGVLFSLTDGSIDDLFWSLFAFSSIVFLLPYVVMAASFLKLRRIDAATPRPYRLPGGAVGARLAATAVVVSLIAAAVFFLWNPFDAFDSTTFWLIAGGLVVTFLIEEAFVALSPRWRARVASSEHPEASAEVQLSGQAPDDISDLAEEPVGGRP